MAVSACLATLLLALPVGAFRNHQGGLSLGSDLAKEQADMLPTRELPESRDGEVTWWVHDDKLAYYPPSALQTGLSANISDYYYAEGSSNLGALSKEMRQRRVGGQGRLHIFYLPEGPSMLQASEVAAKKHMSMSSLSRLEQGANLSHAALHPLYSLSSSYRDPLGNARSKERAVMAGITERLYSYYLDEMTDPSKHKLDVTTRNWKNSAATAKVIAFIKGEFEEMGYTTCVQTFRSWSTRWERGGTMVSNVIAYVKGTHAGSAIMGAHFDSLPERGSAPGAVDNGSGTTAVLTMAKAYSEAMKTTRLSPKRSLYFIAFGGEEANLYGSDRFAQELLRPGSSDSPIPEACKPYPSQDHRAVIMDMIGWKNPRFREDTVTMETERWAAGDTLADLAQSNKLNNGDSLRLEYSLRPYGSDHESFLKFGAKAVLTIDNDGDAEAYPCYHKSCDKKTNVNVRLATEITKMNMGALLRYALLN